MISKSINTESNIYDKKRDFIEDLSNWGKIDNPEIYDHDRSSANRESLSSGIEPRDTHPARREWNEEDAFRSLAFTSVAYGSPTDKAFRGDLQTRVAYQQLSVLAGMAGKVQDVILHNKALFEKQIVMSEAAVQRNTFFGWKAILREQINKRKLLQRATNRISRGLLARSFFTWFDRLSVLDRQSMLIKKVC
eukprot:g630.t1